MADNKHQNRDFVTSLSKGLTVIQAFGPSTPRMTLSEVAAQTGLSRAAVRRLLLTLETLGFVHSSGRYFELSPHILKLGYAFLASHNFTGVIQSMIERVTRDLQESCSVGMLDGNDVVYVARSPAEHRLMSISLAVGTRLPLATTSMGRVLLAGMPDDEQEALLATVEIEAATSRTITDKQALRDELAAIRQQDYCILDQELEPALRSLAVPVRSPGGKVVAAVNVSTNAGRVSREDLTGTFLPVLRHCAETIGPYLG